MTNYLINLYSEYKEENIVRLLEEFEDEVNDYFGQNPITPIIEDFKKHTNSIQFAALVQDPSGLLHIALLTNVIYLRFAENKSSKKIEILTNAFKDSLAKQISIIIGKSRAQISELGHFLKRIATLKLCNDKRSIYILELPIGNSIPSLLLNKIFRSKGLQSEIISIAINRNDSKIKGTTRKELLKAKLDTLDLSNSILIYVDEWITGSNFNNIITILSKISGLEFLPCAFLSNESTQNEKFPQYKSKFDELCNRLGLESEQLLVNLPTLNHTIVSEQKFIWTEIDRIAGYRKLEFVGSIISTFFAIGEVLLEDPQKLNSTLKEAIAEYTKLEPETEIPKELQEKIYSSFQYFNLDFVSDLEEKVKTIELTVNTQFDFETEMGKVISLFENTKGYNEAQPAINIIQYHITKTIISPSSRYFYKGHVPVCLPLEGDEKYLNNLFIMEIEKILHLNCVLE